VFSPFYIPTLDPYDMFECHVGPGYSRIISEFYGIRTYCTIFVPIDDESEIREVKITNKTGGRLEIDAISVVEYTHFDAVKQFNNADWVPQTMQSRCVRGKDGSLTLTQYAFMHRETRVNFLTSNHPVSSFESDRKRFLHTNPWVVIAGAIMGNGDRAYEYYKQINPAAKNDIIDEYECEPYVYAQNILSDVHPQFGLARNSSDRGGFMDVSGRYKVHTWNKAGLYRPEDRPVYSCGMEQL